MTPPICPERVATKLQAIRNLEHPALYEQLTQKPRLVELLWLLQAMSLKPGGLPKFLEDFLRRFGHYLGTQAMADVGIPKEDQWTLAECLAVWRAHRGMERLFSDNGITLVELDELDWGDVPQDRSAGEGRDPSGDFREWYDGTLDEAASVEAIRAGRKYDRARVQFGVQRFNYRFFLRRCRDLAERRLPGYLRDLCEECSYGFPAPRYFVRLFEAFFDYMDAHAASVQASLAPTAVTRTIVRELDFARTKKEPVQLVGDSRFGKTTTASAYCEMWPGRARLVTVPDSNCLRDLFAAHADAFGYAYTDRTSTAQLKAAVEFILRHSGLFPLYDESQFLIPIGYTETTAPKRLNWIRCQVIDRGLGCAFLATPQSYKQTLEKFVKKTGYRMELWLARIAPAITLPDELEWDELLAVARLHFPGLDPDLLELIASRAMQAEGYLKNFEQTAKYAAYLAEEAGRSGPTLQDVQLAMARMMPGSVAQSVGAPSSGRQRARTAPARPLHRGGKDTLRSDKTKPLEDLQPVEKSGQPNLVPA